MRSAPAPEPSAVMTGSAAPALPDLRDVFGPAEGLSVGEGAACAIATVQRDMAAIHHLRAGEFAFQSRPQLNVNIHNLNVHVVLPVDGEVRVGQMKSARSVQAGDVMVISNWAPFQISSHGVDALVVTLPGWWGFQKIISDFLIRDDLHLPRTVFCAPAIHTLVRTLFERDFAPAEGAKAMETLAALLRTGLEVSAAEVNHVRSSTGRIGSIISFICQNMEKEHLSPQDAAVALKCSLRTIHKACSDNGTSFNNIMIDVRISFASYLLSTTRNRISEIAFSSGFGSLSHFCRVFKARLGESATAFRRRYHQQ